MIENMLAELKQKRSLMAVICNSTSQAYQDDICSVLGVAKYLLY